MSSETIGGGLDVRTLHELLSRLGCAVPDEERSARECGPRTRAAITALQGQIGIEQTGTPDADTTAAFIAVYRERCPAALTTPTGPFRVQGTLRRARGGFVANAVVEVFDRDLRQYELLGRGTTNHCGQYSVEYQASAWRALDVGTADLVVRASVGGTIVATSDPVFNAPPVSTIDLTVGGTYLGPSEFDRMTAQLSRVLRFSAADVTFADLDFLAKESGLSIERIGFFVAAHALATQEIRPETLYACFRHHLPLRLEELALRRAVDLRSALERAIATNVIDERDEAWRTQQVEAIRALASHKLLDPASAGSLAALFAAAGVDERAQRAYTAAYVATNGSPVATYSKLREELGDAAVTQVQSALTFAALSLNHAPLLAVLRTDNQEPTRTARLSRDDWKTLIDRAAAAGHAATPERVPGDTEAERRINYADALYRNATSAWPATAIASRLVISNPEHREAHAVLDANPDWDLARVPVHTFAKGRQLDPTTIAELARVQRVYRVTRDPEHAANLLAKDVRSAQQIVTLSIEELSAQSGAPLPVAKAMRKRARANADAAATIYARFAGKFKGVGANAIDNDEPWEYPSPEYATIFGGDGLCACEECAAIDGPAAYLVDLFELLKRSSKDAQTKLFERRPDLQFVELSCDNVNTPLPLIDLVNEILEDVAGSKEPNARQTTWTPDDLAASPEHLEPSAYVPLTTATFPFSLPYDLSLDEARTYLATMGLSRRELLETLRPVATAHDRQWAVETLGLKAAAEADEITLSRTVDVGWSVAAASTLTNVATFLEYARLRAVDLPTLLASPVVNLAPLVGTGPVDVKDLETCDPARTKLTGLTDGFLDRARRFLRLRQRLGWSMADVDRALPDFALPDDKGLQRLAHFVRLHQRTHLPVVELAAWWRPLEISAGSDGASPLYHRVFLSRANLPANVGLADHPLRLSATGEVADTSKTLAAQLEILSGALGVSANELTILGTFGKSNATLLTEQTNLENLTRLFRLCSLARVSGLSANDLVALRAMTTIDPFATDLGNASAFLDAANWAKRSQFSVSDLQSLLQPPQNDSDDSEELTALIANLAKAPDDESIHNVLRSALRLSSDVLELLLKDPTFAKGDQLMTLIKNGDSLSTALRLLRKQAMLINRLALSADELQTLHGGVSFDWSRLPILSDDDPLTWSGFVALIDYVRLRNSLPGELPPVHPSLTSTAPLSEKLTALAESTAWDTASNLEALATSLGITALTLPSLQQLARAVAFARRAGVSAATVAEWVGTSAAAAIKSAARSQYSSSEWNRIAKELRDPIRERQRDALVAYVTGPGKKYPDANALFDQLLIDVEMNACMRTSRIKQAITTTQLFIERCLLGNEKPLMLGDEARAHWAWMRNFRVWQAARRIFLYPENWLFPDVRDDKTPFFLELEQELRKNEVTKATATTALRHYLEKLDAVAHLDMVAMANQPDVVHVLGRSLAAPHVYYYRTQERGWRWTPWEKLDIDIVGDHFAMTVWHQRVFLFWLVIQEKAEQPTALQTGLTDGSSTIEQPKRYVELQLAWSERKGDRWLPRRTSKLDSLRASPEAVRSISFNLYTDSTKLRVQVINASDSVHCELAEFVFDSCHSDPVVAPFEKVDSRRRVTPLKTTYDNTRFIEEIEGSILGDMLVLSKGEQARNTDVRVADTSPTTSGGVLEKTPGRFRLLYPQDQAQPFAPPAFMNDGERAFFIVAAEVYPVEHPGLFRELTPERINGRVRAMLPTRALIAAEPATSEGPRRERRFLDEEIGSRAVDGLIAATVEDNETTTGYRFFDAYHPHACTLLERLDRFGLPGVYSWNDDPAVNAADQVPAQTLVVSPSFHDHYAPIDGIVATPYPTGAIEDAAWSAYRQYNDELFLHIPIYIASRLRTEQRFEEAIDWLRYVFDPTTQDSSVDYPANLWKNARLRRENPNDKSILALLTELAEGKDPKLSEDGEIATLGEQIALWRSDPFNPHLVARLRPRAYKLHVFASYIETLLEWGDSHFRRDTLEELGYATLLYVQAAKLLGKRPEGIPGGPGSARHTYDDLRKTGLDAFGNELENYVPEVDDSDPTSLRFPVAYGPHLAFCVPGNDRILRLWDTVADRLFKIRNCMNIDGLVRDLALFEPPIDPGLLVRARAAGLRLDEVIPTATSAIPKYRFAVLLGRAHEIAGDLRQLGASLLAALEKRDAEALALLRQENEQTLLKAVRDVRVQQVKEIGQQVEAAEASLTAIQTKVDFWKSQPLANPAEATGLALLTTAQVLQLVGQSLHTSKGFVGLMPQWKFGVAGVGGSPYFVTDYGGEQIKSPIAGAADAIEKLASAMNIVASMTTTIGSWQRRKAEYEMQASAGAHEIRAATKQLLAAQIRQNIAECELENHDLQIEHSAGVDELMRQKFTNQDLYDWTIDRLSAVYFQTYQLAFDLAKRAEEAYRFELGKDDAKYSRFIQSGYWDSLRRGLLAGEQLQTDLRRMEVSYLEENKRELELTKHVSLACLDASKLIALQTTGETTFTLSEELFDLDYPGLLLRRIKTVAVSLPCITGRYTTVACKLTLSSSQVRVSASEMKNSNAPLQSIVTSTAQNDTGLFETNLRDERLLPFEGAGAVSTWKLELPDAELAQFDRSTISDVILHVRYTARDGGTVLADSRKTELITALRHGWRLFSTRSELASAWAQFLDMQQTTDDQTLQVTLRPEHFPYAAQTGKLDAKTWITRVWWVDRDTKASLKLVATTPFAIGKDGTVVKLVATKAEIAALPDSCKVTVTVGGVPRVRINPDAIADVAFAVEYDAKTP